MKPILEKKGFKLFFHNKETNKTLPVGWTDTSRGMVTKCKKLLQENEGSYFEYTFEEEVNFKVEDKALFLLFEKVYKEESEILADLANSEGAEGSNFNLEDTEKDDSIKIKDGPATVNDKVISGHDPDNPEPEKPQPKHITSPHVIPKQAEHGYLFCSSKTCDHQIKIEGNLEYKLGTRIYLVCPKCGHKTKVHKVEKTNSLSYAVGAENKGTLIRPNGPKKHMNKKARLRLKRREN